MSAQRIIRRRSVYAERLLAFGEFTFGEGAEFRLRGAWKDFFATRAGAAFDGRVIFEVGCNDGGLLARLAAQHPAAAFVGIDWKCRALHAAAERVAAAGLRNVALLHGRAQDVARIFAEGEVDEVWVFHPEPCDKPRELRNRLFGEPFLRHVHQVLCAGGALVLKTDHPEYHRWALEQVGRVGEPFHLAACSADFWNDAGVQSAVAGRVFADEVTDFEQRYRRKRRPIHYLELRKR